VGVSNVFLPWCTLEKLRKTGLTHQQRSNGVCWGVGEGSICCDEILASEVLSWSVTNEHLQAQKNAQLAQIVDSIFIRLSA